MATAKLFPIIPGPASRLRTKHRLIRTSVPGPKSIALIEDLQRYEPVAMSGMPPVPWAKADGFSIRDPDGNRFLDGSSGVVFANAGYRDFGVVRKVCAHLWKGVFNSYLFANQPRANLVRKLAGMVSPFIPDPRIFLLSTGAEAGEAAIKLMRTAAIERGERQRDVLITFLDGFHGRTLGVQLAGGTPSGKAWVPQGMDSRFAQVPFPDGYRCDDLTMGAFHRCLDHLGIDANRIFGVMFETFQGVSAQLPPVQYAADLRQWTSENGILLCCDEVQAGFWRTGKLFGFEHLGIAPDLITLGKGLGGGFAVSAVVGPSEIMNLYGPGAMSSTNSGNALNCAGAVAQIEVMEEKEVALNVAALAPILADAVAEMKIAANGHIGQAASIGLIAALQFVSPGTKDPAYETAWEIVKRCYERGVLFFAPVGVGMGTIKICPPLIITEEALRELLEVLLEVIKEVCV